MWKQCTKCGKFKALWAFNKHKEGQFGLRPVCSECHCSNSKKNYINSRDKKIEYQRKWRSNNPSAFKEYASENEEKIKFRRMLYRKNNKNKINSKNAEYRASKLNQTPELTELEIKKIKLYYTIAEYLSTDICKWEVDHIIPLSKGGLHHPDNLQVITAYDNVRKNAKLKYKYKNYVVKL